MLRGLNLTIIIFLGTYRNNLTFYGDGPMFSIKCKKCSINLFNPNISTPVFVLLYEMLYALWCWAYNKE